MSRTQPRERPDNRRMTRIGAPRNALVFLDSTAAQPAEKTPPPDQLATGGGRLFSSTKLPLATTGVALAQAAQAELKPAQILQALDSAELEIRAPGVPGKYGHGLLSFEVEPGTMMTVRAKVENGRV